MICLKVTFSFNMIVYPECYSPLEKCHHMDIDGKCLGS